MFRGGRLVSWKVVFTPQAQKDVQKSVSARLKPELERLIELVRSDPYKKTLSFMELVGDLSGAFSRRINIQQRLVYQVLEEEKTVKIIRMWTC